MSDLYLQGKEEGIQANRHRRHPFELFLARDEQKGIHLVPISIGTLTLDDTEKENQLMLRLKL